jgi:hypothetical protein
MGIGVERNGDVGVAQPLLNNLWMHVAGEHVAGVAVPEIMEPDSRQLVGP